MLGDDSDRGVGVVQQGVAVQSVSSVLVSSSDSQIESISEMDRT